MTSTVVLLPRMSVLAVDRVLELVAQKASPADVLGIVDSLPDAATFGSVGGSPASSTQLGQFASELEAAARRAGYPEDRSQLARSKFDAECTRVLADSPILQSGESARDDTWAFIATYLLRPLVTWRFGSSSDRFHGGVRNAFQRLWMRRVLDRGLSSDGRWELVDALSEDAFVQIVERPSIGADPVLARACAEAWLRMSRRIGRGMMEDVMRRAAILVRLRNEVLALSCLDPDELDRTMDEMFERAARELGIPVPDDAFG
jgi:hypothetical protein